MRRSFAAVHALCAGAAFLCALFARPLCSAAYLPSATVNSVTGGPLAFVSSTMTNSVLSAGTLTVSLSYSTTAAGSGGSVSIVPTATLAGTGGNTLDTRDFSVTCTDAAFPTLFTSLGTLQLNGTTTCGTLPAGNHNANISITVAITLDTTLSATTPFLADTYSSATFSVTAAAT